MGVVVIVLLLALVFGWVAGLAEIAGTPDDEFASGTRTAWLLIVIFTGIVGLVAYVLVGKQHSEAASAGTSGRLAPQEHLITTRHFDGRDRYTCSACSFETWDADKARQHRADASVVLANQVAPTGRSNGHRVRCDLRDNMYWCQDCNFWSLDLSQAEAHGGQNVGQIRAGLRPDPSAQRARVTGFAPTLDGPVHSTPMPAQRPDQNPAYKFCPDCAEEVRAAARKCRFCGHIFEGIPAVG